MMSEPKRARRFGLRLPRRMSMKPLSVRLYEDQEQKLREIAKRNGTTVLDVIRASADMAIESEKERGK